MPPPSADGGRIGGHKGSVTTQELANEFGVSASTIDRVKTILEQGTAEQIQSLRDKSESGVGPGVAACWLCMSNSACCHLLTILNAISERKASEIFKDVASAHLNSDILMTHLKLTRKQVLLKNVSTDKRQFSEKGHALNILKCSQNKEPSAFTTL